MSAKTPRVWDTYVEDPQPPHQAIWLDTPAWFQWLEAPTTLRFTYPVFDPAVGYIVGFMTVRKERRQRGGWYWSVYRRSGGLCGGCISGAPARSRGHGWRRLPGPSGHPTHGTR